MATAPLIRARRFEKALNTGAHIYVKYEGVSPVGSHKTNSAVARAYYNSIDGVRKLLRCEWSVVVGGVL